LAAGAESFVTNAAIILAAMDHYEPVETVGVMRRPLGFTTMSFEEIKQQVQDWVTYCLQVSVVSALPYIDAPIEIDESFHYVSKIGRQLTGEIRAWQD